MPELALVGARHQVLKYQQHFSMRQQVPAKVNDVEEPVTTIVSVACTLLFGSNVYGFLALGK